MKFDREGSTTVTLSRAEALVLFEWLNVHEGTVPADDAERTALSGLTAALEKILVEPFDPEYHRLLAAARAMLSPPEDAP